MYQIMSKTRCKNQNIIFCVLNSVNYTISDIMLSDENEKELYQKYKNQKEKRQKTDYKWYQFQFDVIGLCDMYVNVKDKRENVYILSNVKYFPQIHRDKSHPFCQYFSYTPNPA